MAVNVTKADISLAYRRFDGAMPVSSAMPTFLYFRG